MVQFHAPPPEMPQSHQQSVSLTEEDKEILTANWHRLRRAMTNHRTVANHSRCDNCGKRIPMRSLTWTDGMGGRIHETADDCLTDAPVVEKRKTSGILTHTAYVSVKDRGYKKNISVLDATKTYSQEDVEAFYADLNAERMANSGKVKKATTTRTATIEAGSPLGKKMRYEDTALYAEFLAQAEAMRNDFLSGYANPDKSKIANHSRLRDVSSAPRCHCCQKYLKTGEHVLPHPDPKKPMHLHYLASTCAIQMCDSYEATFGVGSVAAYIPKTVTDKPKDEFAKNVAQASPKFEGGDGQPPMPPAVVEDELPSPDPKWLMAWLELQKRLNVDAPLMLPAPHEEFQVVEATPVISRCDDLYKTYLKYRGQARRVQSDVLALPHPSAEALKAHAARRARQCILEDKIRKDLHQRGIGDETSQDTMLNTFPNEKHELVQPWYDDVDHMERIARVLVEYGINAFQVQKYGDVTYKLLVFNLHVRMSGPVAIARHDGVKLYTHMAGLLRMANQDASFLANDYVPYETEFQKDDVIRFRKPVWMILKTSSDQTNRYLGFKIVAHDALDDPKKAYGSKYATAPIDEIDAVTAEVSQRGA